MAGNEAADRLINEAVASTGWAWLQTVPREVSQSDYIKVRPDRAWLQEIWGKAIAGSEILRLCCTALLEDLEPGEAPSLVDSQYAPIVKRTEADGLKVYSSGLPAPEGLTPLSILGNQRYADISQLPDQAANVIASLFNSRMFAKVPQTVKDIESLYSKITNRIRSHRSDGNCLGSRLAADSGGDLKYLYKSLKPAYQKQAVWVIHPAYAGDITTMQDDLGEWILGIEQAIHQPQLFGKEIIYSEYADQHQYPVIIGDWYEGYSAALDLRQAALVLQPETYRLEISLFGKVTEPNAFRCIEKL